MKKIIFSKKSLIMLMGLLILFTASITIVFVLYSEKSFRIALKFKESDIHQSTSRISINLDVNKVKIPAYDSLKTTELNPFNMGLFANINDMFAKDLVKTLDLEIIIDRDEAVGKTWADSCEIYIQKNASSIVLKINDIEQPEEENFFTLLKLIIGEDEQIRKLAPNGKWIDLPTVLGFNLAMGLSDKYISQLLNYSQSAGSYPHRKMKIGHTWKNNMQFQMPVDSLSDGQYSGHIIVDIQNSKRLEKVENNIANISYDLLTKVNWELEGVTEKGFTKCDILFTGKGYYFFDIKKGWKHGMFLKGDLSVLIDAEPINPNDNEKKEPVYIDLTGKVEIATKIK